MTPETETTEKLLREICSALVEHPDRLSVQSAPGTFCDTVFTVEASESDQGLLIGKGGTHCAALSFLVERFGKARHREYALRITGPQRPAESRETTARSNPATPPQCAYLLSSILAHLGMDDVTVSYSVEARHGHDYVYDFAIEVRGMSAFRFLLQPGEHVLNRAANGKILDRRQTNLVAEIGTILRAIGRKSGMRLEVNVDKLGCDANGRFPKKETARA